MFNSNFSRSFGGRSMEGLVYEEQIKSSTYTSIEQSEVKDQMWKTLGLTRVNLGKALDDVWPTDLVVGKWLRWCYEDFGRA